MYLNKRHIDPEPSHVLSFDFEQLAILEAGGTAGR